MTNHRTKSVLWFILRLSLCGAALAYVFSRTDFHDTVTIQDQPKKTVRLVSLRQDTALVVLNGAETAVPISVVEKEKEGAPVIHWGLVSLARHCNWKLLLLAIALFGIQPLLQIVRFQWMLRLQKIAVDWPTAGAVCFVGNFYNYVIPGTTGGDLVRAGYLMRSSPNRHGALAAILLDRVTGMAGLFGLAALAGLLLPAEQPIVRHAAAVSGLITLGMIVGFMLVTGWPAIGRLLHRLPLGSHLRQFYEAVSVDRRGWPRLAAAVILTIILQSGSMAAFSVAAVALGMAPAWSTYFVCLPVSQVIAAIPIAPQGLGQLEAAMIALLAGQVGSSAQVLGLAFAMRIMGLLWALPGGVLPFLWRGAQLADQVGHQTGCRIEAAASETRR